MLGATGFDLDEQIKRDLHFAGCHWHAGRDLLARGRRARRVGHPRT